MSTTQAPAIIAVDPSEDSIQVLAPAAFRSLFGNISASTEWRMRQRDPEFPRPVRISPGRIGYLASDAKRYIAARRGVNR